jgi:hypothetical protein
VGRTQSARETKCIEFHGIVRLPRVSPGAQLAPHRESAAAASCRKQVRLTGRKVWQLVQIEIGVESLRGSSLLELAVVRGARGRRKV